MKIYGVNICFERTLNVKLLKYFLEQVRDTCSHVEQRDSMLIKLILACLRLCVLYVRFSDILVYYRGT